MLNLIRRSFRQEVRSSMNLSRRIRDLRYAKGWGPDELASRAKISRTALYQIERGNTSKPQAGTLRRISRALGVPLEVLLTTTMVPNEDTGPITADMGVATSAPTTVSARFSPLDRAGELLEKFRLILASPLAEGVARIVEESYRLLPIMPPPTSGDPAQYVAPIELKPTRQSGSRSSPALSDRSDLGGTWNHH
jgi:transcriptional regulator with XRE-family HTH domain